MLDCCIGQFPSNEMTVVLARLQATKGLLHWSVSRRREGRVAQSKPCLGAAGSRGMWARNSLREGGMSGPSGDEGNGDGLAQGALAGSGFGELADELFAPTASCFKYKNDSAAATQRPGWTSSGHVRSLDLRASRSGVPAYCPLCCQGAAWLVKAETMVVSMANWFPPHRGNPFAMTSIRRLSMRWTMTLMFILKLKS